MLPELIFKKQIAIDITTSDGRCAINLNQFWFVCLNL